MTIMLDMKSESLKVEKGKFEFACVKCNLSFKMTKDLKANVATSGYSRKQILQLHKVQILLFHRWSP